MKQVKRTFFVIAAIVAACFFGTNDVKAQEFTVQGDLVSLSLIHISEPTRPY